MKKFPLRNLGVLLPLILFSLALWVLHRQLREYSYAHIAEQFSAIPLRTFVFALAACALSYVILTAYDVLALRAVHAKLSYPRTALASFVGYTLSHNLGFSLLTGGAARFRLFSLWGLSASQIAGAIAFSGLMFWVGFLILLGALFMLAPPPVLEHLPVVEGWMRPLGALLFFGTGALLTVWEKRNFTIRIKDWEFPAPPASLLLSCVAVAAVDWIAAAATAYLILPQLQISFWQFVSVFQLAQIIGFLSHVPGGLGVFEGLIVVFLSSEVPASTLAGALVAYRLIYYILPLTASSILLLVHELRHEEGFIRQIAPRVRQRLLGVIPLILTLLTFLAGVVLLFSGATPAVPERMSFLSDLVPLSLIELSHFLGSLAGIGLLLLARGLQRKLDGAYVLTVALLAVGVVASLLKGFDYEEAGLLLFCLIVLLPCRNYFYRKSTLLSDPLSPEWLTAVVLVLVATVWLVLFSNKHVQYTQELWWQFSFFNDAPRSLRAVVGSASVAAVWSVFWLLSPAPSEPAAPTRADLDRAAPLVREATRTYASLALLGDKELLFHESGRAFIMYGIEGRTYVSLGDPIGDESIFTDLVWDFRELVDRHSGQAVFYLVHPLRLPLYIDVGLNIVKLGEEAIVDLPQFSLDGRNRASMRHIRNRFSRDRFTFRIAPVEETPALLPALKTVSDDWLRHKNTREKGFSLGYFDEEYLRRFPVALIEREGTIVAFANVWAGAYRAELSVDLMRYNEQAPSGVMEYLFLELMLWGREEGYQTFNLGMAPLSGLEDRELAPLWHKIGGTVFRFGEHFYNFQGLRAYKEKFDPRWEPRYLASPGGLRLPSILTNVAALISGGFRGILSK